MTLLDLHGPFSVGPNGEFSGPKTGVPFDLAGRIVLHQPSEPVNRRIQELLGVSLYGTVTFLFDARRN